MRSVVSATAGEKKPGDANYVVHGVRAQWAKIRLVVNWAMAEGCEVRQVRAEHIAAHQRLSAAPGERERTDPRPKSASAMSAGDTGGFATAMPTTRTGSPAQPRSARTRRNRSRSSALRQMAAHAWRARADLASSTPTPVGVNGSGDLKKFSGLELLAAAGVLAHLVVRSSSTAAASLDERRAGGPALSLTASSSRTCAPSCRSAWWGILRTSSRAPIPAVLAGAPARVQQCFVLAKAPPGATPSSTRRRCTGRACRLGWPKGRRWGWLGRCRRLWPPTATGDGLVNVRLDGRMFWARQLERLAHGVVFNPATRAADPARARDRAGGARRIIRKY